MLLQSRIHCQISHDLNDYTLLKYFHFTKCQFLSVISIYVKITSVVKYYVQILREKIYLQLKVSLE